MKRTAIWFILAAVLLSACGEASSTSGATHEGMQTGQGPAPAGSGEHAGHGGASKNEPAAAVSARWTFAPEKPQPGQEVKIAVRLTDAAGKPIDKFDINHEKKMHLIAVNKELTYFDHLHPEWKGNGTFEVTTKLPEGGEYKLIADFIPAGFGAMTRTQWMTVQGPVSRTAAIVPDSSLSKSVDGKEITLTTGNLAPGKEAALTFRFTDKAGKPITDLQPYLGAVGHVVILSADTEQYLHVHPMDEKATGPDAWFMTAFPKSGVYKIWGQFQQNGHVFVVPYTIQVP
ncbi:hypothetical protein O9H85_11450 [Paenibacillus filicis]|uniref:YtkA-like domain-containing protein n=1 Tax=Paenibacillus gyeongsangnamensis TaxID=3388067 RepID=A0ABT4Q822_9BACL|nr:hypothetical protein [Paenibacillus filicis]MCZ8513026.1 hypothetical protein [Paenibacillus filicis]